MDIKGVAQQLSHITTYYSTKLVSDSVCFIGLINWNPKNKNYFYSIVIGKTTVQM